MWNNQLSTFYSKKLISNTQLHGINYIIPGAYCTPNGKDCLPLKIKVVDGTGWAGINQYTSEISKPNEKSKP